jgi:hypothetical protein
MTHEDEFQGDFSPAVITLNDDKEEGKNPGQPGTGL